MNALPLTVLLLTYLLLAGCASLPNHRTQVLPPQTQYDAIITNGKGALLSINELASQLRAADVIVIGEYHGHHGSHLLQSLLQSALYQQRPQQVLTMEQFTLDHQQELDHYLAGRSGESELIADARAWSNYKASYRPMVEFSKSRNIPVVAANAPADTVRCVGRKGEAYLDSLEKAERNQLPESPFVDTPAYREKFFSTLATNHSSGTSARVENSYKAQLLRDNTMADQVIKAMRDDPGHQVIHLTGTFHAEDRLGMVAVLEKKRPDLAVAVISPAFWQAGDDFQGLVDAHQQKGDFLYFLQPLPQEYTDNERRRNAIREQFRQAADISCD
ncbi:MAG: ChaN family lipoprotein [Marinobacter sp.]